MDAIYFKTELGAILPAYVQSFSSLEDFKKAQPLFSDKEAKRIFDAHNEKKFTKKKTDQETD